VIRAANTDRGHYQSDLLGLQFGLKALRNTCDFPNLSGELNTSTFVDVHLTSSFCSNPPPITYCFCIPAAFGELFLHQPTKLFCLRKMQRGSCDQTGRKAIPFATTPCRFCGQNFDIPNDTIMADYAIRQHFQRDCGELDLDRYIERHRDNAQLQRESEYKDRLSKLFELSQKFGIAKVCGSVDTTPTAAADSGLISSMSGLTLDILEEAAHCCQPTADTKHLPESKASAEAQTQHQPQEESNTSLETVLRFHCDFCDKTFRYNIQKRQHMRVHFKPFQCPVCDRCFSLNSDLQRHQSAVHMKEKPFCCTKCGRGFSRFGDLQRHQTGIHKKLKPFPSKNLSQTFQPKA